MIKLTYNGFAIEVDSIADVKEIIKGHVATGVGSPAQVSKLGRPLGSKNKRKHYHSNRWLADELNQIFTALDNQARMRDIVNYSPLRERHSKSSIMQMVYRVTSNRSASREISKEIREMIRNYHELKGTKVAVRTY